METIYLKVGEYQKLHLIYLYAEKLSECISNEDEVGVTYWNDRVKTLINEYNEIK